MLGRLAMLNDRVRCGEKLSSEITRTKRSGMVGKSFYVNK